MNHIASLDLGLSDFAVLEVLMHKGPLPVQQIAKKVLLTSGSMTAALDRLERRSLIERQENAEDRRIRVVRLTSAGRQLIRSAFEEHKYAMEETAGGVTAAERTTLIDLLKKLGRYAGTRAENFAAKSGGNKGRREQENV